MKILQLCALIAISGQRGRFVFGDFGDYCGERKLDMKTKSTVDGRTYRIPERRGRKTTSADLKQSQPITFWETKSREALINREAKKANMSRSAFCSLAIALYIEDNLVEKLVKP